MRVRFGLSAAAIGLLTLGLACGGGGDDDGDGTTGGADASSVDAASTAPDSGPSAYSGLGQTCTGEGQGDCPDGFECFPLAAGSWCSKDCTPGMHAPCQVDYEGPGLPLCLVGVDENNDGTADRTICGILCEDTGAGACDANTCDGTCPSELECVSPVTNQDGDEVGKACQ